MRTLAELRGSAASFSCARKRSSIGFFWSITTAFSALRLAAYWAVSLRRRLFFSTELVFAIQNILVSLPLLPEREVEATQQGARLIIRLGGRTNDDVHAPDLIDLVVVDLREHDVLLDAERKIAAPVEALRAQAAEVAHARQRDVDQPVEEFVHAFLAQRDLGADRHVLAHLEAGDRLAGAGDHGLLAGDHGEILGRHGRLLGIAGRLADAHVDDDLVEARDLHLVLVV